MKHRQGSGEASGTGIAFQDFGAQGVRIVDVGDGFEGCMRNRLVYAQELEVAGPEAGVRRIPHPAPFFGENFSLAAHHAHKKGG